MIPESARKALEARLGADVRLDAPLARCTSLQVGGPADALATPRDRRALADLLGLCAAHALPYAVLGGGFNTLVPDVGVRGVVIQLAHLRRLELRGPDTLYAEAGTSHARLVNFCRDRGLSGLEFGVGIPGTLGGWLAMNAGIPDRETRDVVREIEWMDAEGAQQSARREDLAFAYRSLRLAPGAIVLAALLAVAQAAPEAVREDMRRLLERRAATQPIDRPSCGSVFKNPEGDHAGRLIEAAGLKGTCVGGAEISTLHANFIVNRGGARAADVLALIELARSRVREHFGVELETEVRVLGAHS